MFNSEKYIETCIKSILNQTFQDYEVIIVDDCSTDKSVDVIQKFNDPRIKIFHQLKNSGESSSRNFGLNLANGKYIYFMDHDDAILPNTLEIFYNAIEESNADVVYMNSYFEAQQVDTSIAEKFATNKKFISNPQPRFLSDNISERMQKEYMLSGLQVFPWIKIQRRDFLRQNGLYFPEVLIGGDVLFEVAELISAQKMQVIDACCYLYRQTPNQTMKSSSKTLLKKAILSLPKMISYFDEIFSKANVSNELKIRCEIFTVRITYFVALIFHAYAERIPIDEINEMINELVGKVGITSPDLTRILINSLAEEMTITQNLLKTLSKK